MESKKQPLEKLAEAVLLFRSVDWDSAESTAEVPDRETVGQLRVLASIAELHRKFAEDDPGAARRESSERKPERWGRLEIRELIGRGSFGEVYRAWDTKLDREVAVKLLHAGDAKPEAAAVLREARHLARVRHPNVVTVYDADEIDGRVGLWMELIRGRNLEEILQEEKKFDDGEVMRVGIDLCRALGAVHEAGLLHRDIKTQNLVQAEDGRLVLMDFGTGGESEKTASTESDAAGTPLYLAPEIFLGAPATVQSDIYSAGVLLFHLLTGTYPVRGATVREVHEAHAHERRLAIESAAPGAKRALGAVIARAIEPDSSARFESAREMLAALENAQRRADVRKKSSWAVAAIGAVAAILVSVFPAVRRFQQDRNRPAPDGRATYVGTTPQKRAVQMPALMLAGTPSPDGRYLPYSEASAGNLALYEFATGASRVLTRTGDGGAHRAEQSIVSRDGRQVAYSWVDGDSGQLRVVDVEGGKPKILSSEPGATAVLPLEWAPDGRHILGARQWPGGKTDVVLISALDGSLQKVRTFVHAPGNISLSPDGRSLAYDRAEDAEDRDRGIFLSGTGGREVPVVTGPTYDSHPMWTPDGRGLVFASMRTGSPALWLQEIENGLPRERPRLLDKDMGAFLPMTLTRGGSLFYRSRVGLMDVYTVPIDPITGEIRGEPANASNGFLGSNLAADWSPDGRTLVYASWRTMFGPGRNILVFHSLTTGLEREVRPEVDLVNLPSWSPDGRRIAIGGPDRHGLRALRIVDADSGTIVATFLAQPGDMPPFSSLAWEPNGRRIYLKRPGKITRIDVTSGEEEVVYQPLAGEVLGPLSISPDGRWLAFNLNSRTLHRSRLVAIPTGGGPSRDLVEQRGPGVVNVGGWTRDGKRILFTRNAADPAQNEICVVPFEGGSPRSLGLSKVALRDLRVSPDGSRISFTTGFPDQSIWVFDNFLPQPAAR